MKVYKFFPEGWREERLTEENEIKQGIVEKCDSNYNLYVKLENGKEGIIPRKEIEAINVEKDGFPRTRLCVGKVNKYVQFKIIGKQGNDLLLSRKAVQQDVIKYIKNDLKEGQIVKGIVKSITPYGAFVDIGGGVVGLVHIEDLSVARMKSPSERVKIGQNVNVVIKSIDRDTGRVNLSYKETFGTWEENAKNFTVGMKTHGIIRETEKNKNGIFIELTPNLVGMAEYKEGLNYGEDIEVMVKRIDYNKKKVKLLIL